MHGNNMRIAATAALTAALTACGGGGVGLQSALLGLPTEAPHAPLATTTTYTSPDGGIYRNSLHLDVLLVGRHDGHALAQQLGASWNDLDALGDATVVAFRLHNTGKAFSDPEVRDLQIASDFAPKQAEAGPLRHYYHPTYALAAVSTSKLDSSCRPHLDPGQSIVVVLVYPPVQVPAGGIVWGRYQEFALRLPSGGATALGDAHLYAALCPSVRQQP
ncbi:MAG TPA: hypothetical protein VGQ42_00985 [Candidatus Dormibacteraeota bacterium]|jgi:hypothetical protein|nr:hypothetical protein [Candidatus Dormibacteraeota bacterium]